MASKVKVKFSHPHGKYKVDDTASLDADEARRVIDGGVAVPATVADAKQSGADPESAASKQ